MVKGNASACSKLLQSLSPLSALRLARMIIVPVSIEKCFRASGVPQPAHFFAVRVGSIRQFAAGNDKIGIPPDLRFFGAISAV
jgi:hypothetical protein